MPWQTSKQNSLFFFSRYGEWHTDGLVVVGRYTHARQRWLKAKIVKFGHDRYYKETLAMYRKVRTASTTVL